MHIVLKDMTSISNFAIKVFWANPSFIINDNYNRFFPLKTDLNIINTTVKGKKYDGTKVECETSQKSINFGNQTLFFDVININKEGASNDFEHIIIYKPGSKINITENIKNNAFPINFSLIKKQGFSLAKNRDDESYFLAY